MDADGRQVLILNADYSAVAPHSALSFRAHSDTAAKCSTSFQELLNQSGETVSRIGAEQRIHDSFVIAISVLPATLLR